MPAFKAIFTQGRISRFQKAHRAVGPSKKRFYCVSINTQSAGSLKKYIRSLVEAVINFEKFFAATKMLVVPNRASNAVIKLLISLTDWLSVATVCVCVWGAAIIYPISLTSNLLARARQWWKRGRNESLIEYTADHIRSNGSNCEIHFSLAPHLMYVRGLLLAVSRPVLVKYFRGWEEAII